MRSTPARWTPAGLDDAPCHARQAKVILADWQSGRSGTNPRRGNEMHPVLCTGRRTAMGVAATCVLASTALAQRDKMTPVPTPPQPNAIQLGTAPLPGATASESWHRQYGSLFARNVTVATLTPYLP